MVKKKTTFVTNFENAFYCWFVRSRCVRVPCFKEFQKIFDIEREICVQSWRDFGKKHSPEEVRPSHIGVLYVKSANLKSIVLRRYWSVHAETFTRAYYMYVLSICTGKHISSLWSLRSQFSRFVQKCDFFWPFRYCLFRREWVNVHLWLVKYVHAGSMIQAGPGRSPRLARWRGLRYAPAAPSS